MALGKIAQILVDDIEPQFKRVRFTLSTDYQWGSGWDNYLSKEAFDDAMCSCFGSNGWNVREPEESSGCVTVRKYDGQYLYLHPMEITGYIRPDALSELNDILSEVSEDIIHSHDGGKLGEDVYALSDCDVARLFSEHKAEIWDEISPFVNKTDPKYLNNDIFDKLLPEAVIPRNNESSGVGYFSSMIEYGMLINEAASILEMQKRIKDMQQNKNNQHKKSKPSVR